MNISEVKHDDGAFVPRGYQLEMLEASLAGNIIIAMDTGSGKTPIAMLRIAAELERCAAHKSVWFLCPKVALAQQQFRVLQKMLPATPCKVLVGSDGCDLWSSQSIWDEVLLNARVVICTPEILYNALSHGFVKMSSIALLVFDEAHYCKDKHPANCILTGFYHPERLQGKEIPHILGLTASPMFGNAVLGLETIEKNLDSICRTPRLNREELMRYTHQPLLIQQSFSHTYMPKPPLLDSLVRQFGMESIYDDPWIKQLKADKKANPQKVNDAILRGQTNCRDQLRTLVHAANTIHTELGSWACERYLIYSIDQFRTKHEDSLCVGSLDRAESKYLLTFFQRLDATPVFSRQPPDTQTITGKVNALIRILQEELSSTNGLNDIDTEINDTVNSRLTGIVFVETRVAVCMLKQLLESHPSVNERLRLGLSFGGSTHPKRKSMICDYILKDKSIEPIEDVLDGLRSRDKNLLITTNVVEEGIDVTACNTVICFDQSPNLVSFVQRRGRARDSRSRYYIMHSEVQNGASISRWLELEASMKAKYMDHMRELSRLQADELSQQGFREYRVKSTGARLTLHDALSHLHHFCNTLGSVRYASSNPVFIFEGDVQGGNGICRVVLPSCVDESLRNFRSSRCWTTEKLLKADAAFEACIALHQAGLLNNNMLPIKDLSEEESTMYQIVEKRPNVVAVNSVFSPWPEIAQVSQNPHAYLKRLITIRKGNEVLIRMALLMAGMPNHIESFNLYIDAQQTLNVSFGDALPMNILNLASAARFTKMMIYSNFRSRMKVNEALLPIWYLPLDGIHESWFSREARPLNAICSQSTSVTGRNAGLVSDKGGRLFIPHGMQEIDVINEKTGTIIKRNMIRASVLPKRCDFLHCIPAGDLPKKVESVLLDPEMCTMDRFPLRHTQFGKLVPSIQHKICNALLVERLNNTVLARASISSLPLILEAISAPASHENVNYQRMEFLGDAIFKYYTAVTIMGQHLNYPEGYLAYTKDLIVSNKSAALAAKEAGLDRFIIRTNFTGAKWQPVYMKDVSSGSVSNQDTCVDELSTKVLADVVEALIAAAYLDGQQTEPKVLAMLNIFTCSGLRQKVTWEPLASLQQKLRSAVPKFDSTPPIVQQLEAMTGYAFKHPALVVEALTHPGHVTLTSDTLGCSQNYQRLEFLGDAVLDMIVTRFIYSHNKSTPVFRMHLLRTAAVNQDILGYLALRLSIEIETSELVDNAKTSSKNPSSEPSRLPHRANKRITLLQLLRHAPSIQLIKDISEMQKRCQDLDTEIDHALKYGRSYPWTLLASLSPEKLASDLIEAIIGAMYIDSNGDLDVCQSWIARIGILPWLRRAMEQGVKVWHPKEELGVLADTKKVKYQITNNSKQQGGLTCTLYIGDRKICQAQGPSRKISEMKAAEIAVEMLSQSQDRKATESNTLKADGLKDEIESMEICS